MIKSGVINENKTIELENDDVLSYLYKLIDKCPFNKSIFEDYKMNRFFWTDSNIVDYFVKFLGYVVIYNKIVYFQSESKCDFIDKIDYVKNGFLLKPLSKVIYKNKKFIQYSNPIEQEINIIGFKHSISPENNLSFWYPKIVDAGFKTPRTIIIDFTETEMTLIKMGKWYELCERDLLRRIKEAANKNPNFNLNDEIFVRFGHSSNKFNFNSCHIKMIDELYSKLMVIFEDMYTKLEWHNDIELILREYVQTTYQRDQIYNGMPLNTEFRVFYDFNQKEILGVFNYWEKDTMLNNLRNKNDLIAFANSATEIESEFNNLAPILTEEVVTKAPLVNLNGRWSLDFLYDGKQFVLIDMAHAECSYYYDKVLSKKFVLK
ncbi:MAG: hypothetical protein E7165_03125 [Firmicutes bacterium]|nr:hypothetical protein [Bacillota bacterium]